MTVCYFHTINLSVLMIVKPSGNLKITNREVMTDWARWIIGVVENLTGILNLGSVDTFAEQWPHFMQQGLDP